MRTESPSQNQRAKATYGIVPNLFQELGAYTSMPSAVYMDADDALTGCVLPPAEQQVVLLELARSHHSAYDAVIHARIALDAGLPPETIDQLLAGEPAADDRIAALVAATRLSCENRGWLGDSTLDALAERGIGRGELYEIFALIGMKTFTSFTDHLAELEIDDPLQSLRDRLDHLPDEPETLERQRLFVG